MFAFEDWLAEEPWRQEARCRDSGASLTSARSTLAAGGSAAGLIDVPAEDAGWAWWPGSAVWL